MYMSFFEISIHLDDCRHAAGSDSVEAYYFGSLLAGWIGVSVGSFCSHSLFSSFCCDLGFWFGGVVMASSGLQPF